jgi:CheY-like chemotaxis protein
VVEIPLNQLRWNTGWFWFERDIAENGKIAVEKCKVILTMILMDLQMPEMNGFEDWIY